MADERDIDQRLIRAGEEWRRTVPRLGSPYREFRRQATSTGHSLLATLVSSAAVLAIVAVAVAVILSLPTANPGPVAQPTTPGASSIPPTPVPATGRASATPDGKATPPATPATPLATPNLPPLAGLVAQWLSYTGQIAPFPLWSPDSEHVLIVEDFPSTPSAAETSTLLLLTADGPELASYAGYREPAWLGADEFIAYQASAIPDNPHSMVQITAILGNAMDGSTTDISAPCCWPVGNGDGAVAVSWLPPQQDGNERPQFSVWSDGRSTEPRDGYADTWSPTGDKLIVVHPFGGQPVLEEGWIELVGWPGLATIFEGDHTKAAGDATFDPTGEYLAYSDMDALGQGRYSFWIDMVKLATGDMVRIPIAGEQGMSVTFAWDSAGNLVVSDVVAGTLATYRLDGSQMNSQPYDPANYTMGVVSSADGSTVLIERQRSDIEDLQVELTIEREGRTTQASSIGGPEPSWLSPNGEHLIVFDAGQRLGIANIANIP